MDSINKQQPEHNREDLTGGAAVERIRNLAETAKTCFFCTNVAKGTHSSRPMSVQEVDENGNIWFLSASDSHLNQELMMDPAVRLYFQGSPHSDFMELTGTALISRDQKRIKELWNPIYKTWFTEGEDDPRITVIMVEPSTGYYWDNKHGHFVAGAKMLIGAMTGRTLDDSIEGTLSL